MDKTTIGDLGQAVVALVIFGIMLFILGRYAWKPIIAQLKRREQEIAERLRETERRQREAKELEAQYRQRLDGAEAEAKQLLAESIQEAARTREDVLAAAREESNKAIQVARVEIEQFKQAAIEDLQRATADLAVNIAGQIIREEMSEEKQRKLADESLERIRSRASREGP